MQKDDVARIAAHLAKCGSKTGGTPASPNKSDALRAELEEMHAQPMER